MTEKMVVGICWYRPDQWQRLKQIAADADKLDETYVEWQQNARRAMRGLRAQGLRVKKVAIDLDAMLLWCQQEGIPLDGEARSRYTSLLLSRQK